MTAVATHDRPRVTTLGPATLRRAHGLNILNVAGTFEEMGRQHGALLRDEIRRGPMPYYRTFAEKLMRGAAPGSVGRVARRVVQQTVGRSIAKNIPDFGMETLRGLAEGAELPFAEVLEAATMPDTLMWLAARMIDLKGISPATRHRLALGLGCTSAIAWGDATRDGKLYHARNLDYHGVRCWPSTAAVVFHRPNGGQRYVSCSAAGVVLGGFTAMNEAGLTLTVHQHMFTDRTELGGTPIALVGDIVMREARTLEQARAILARHKPIGCWTYLIADGHRKEVLCWEEDPQRNVARMVPTAASTFGYANIYLDEELGASERDLYPTYWRHNHGRYAHANRLLKEKHGTLDAAGMAGILADIGDTRDRLRDSIAMTLTVASVVFRPEDGTLWVGTGEAPTSHGLFVPLSLHTGDVAEQAERFTPGDAFDPATRDAFERWRRAYVAFVDDEDLAEARRELAMACTLSPEQPAYHAVAGMFALKDLDHNGACDLLGRAIALGHPDEERVASFHLWRGRARDVAGSRADAERDYRTVIGMRADAMVRAAAERGLRRPFDKRAASKIHVDMSLGDVIAP
jgi:hypothetical protein